MVEQDENRAGLKPYITPLGVFSLAFGCAVGWGAFVMPGTTFLPVAGPVGSAVGMLCGAVLMMIIAANYGYLMNLHGGSGGAFTYTTEAFGYDHGFLAAWFLILAYVAVMWANATAIVLVARNLLGDTFQTGFYYQIAGYDIFLGEALVTLFVLWFFGAVCLFGRRLSVLIQTVMALLLFAGIIICFTGAMRQPGALRNISPGFAQERAPVLQVFRIVALAPWAFVGFESISHSREEFLFSPKKSMRIMVLALTAGGISYALLSLMAATVLPPEYDSWTQYIPVIGQLGGTKGLPVFYATEEALGETGSFILGITLLGGIVTGLVGNYIAASRLIYALGREGIMPPCFGKTGRMHTPKCAILLLMVISTAIPFIGRTAIGWIVDVTTIGATITYGYVSAAAFKAAKRAGRTRITVTGLTGVILSVLFSLYLLVPNVWTVSALASESYFILAVWGILGFVFFRYVFAVDKEKRFGKSTVVWIALLFMIFFTSAMWMRQSVQETADNVKTDVLDFFEEEMIDLGVNISERRLEMEEQWVEFESSRIRQSLLDNSLVQMGLTVIALAIIFSIFNLMLRREKALEQERAKAEESSVAKSSFLSSMSHEIRTPINAVLGMNEMIIRESKNERIISYARNVESAGKNLLSIINDILDFSKIEAGKMELVEAPYRLSSVLNDLTNMVSFRARAKNLTFEVTVEETLPDGLFGDEVRVRQVVTNLLNNAVKYTKEGSVRFIVSGERREGADDLIDMIFSVQDTGIGVKTEEIPKLFEKFERADLDKNKTIEGTGLGLSITKNLLDMMQGKIIVESEYGKGSTFTARIPQIITEDEPIGDFHEKFERHVKDLKAYRESFRAPEARILAVDDTDMNLTVIEGLLNQTEVQIDTALSGAEALEKTAEKPYDLILMDHRMPGMDGTEALNRLREREGGMNRLTPVICLTADAVSGAREKYLEQGFTDYLSKPVEGAALEAMLIRYLPKENVRTDVAGAKKTVRADEGESALRTFYMTAGLDYESAIRSCGTDAILEKSLAQFYRAIEKNAGEIERFLAEQDYRNYTIRVHALKSSARLIGALRLSEDAQFLEE
ncbi:MAG: amino acid permease, partial [Butyrivibrio sp.]|nr:amino acid permease [Butyrivibrio sp.]